MMKYRVAAAAFTAADGVRLAAGCICEAHAYEECMERLNMLKDYKASAKDLVGIDFEIAGTICSLFHSEAGSENSPVIAAGASVRIIDAKLPYGVTTGGILGDPNEEPESSEDESEELKAGFNLMTLSGSPGIAADCDRGSINTVLYLVKKLKEQGRIKDEALLDELFESFGIHTALLVFDGTGEDQEVFMASKDEQGTRIWM